MNQKIKYKLMTKEWSPILTKSLEDLKNGLIITKKKQYRDLKILMIQILPKLYKIMIFKTSFLNIKERKSWNKFK